MGATLWYFARERAGQLRPVTRKAATAFFDAQGIVPVDEDGHVRLVCVVVVLDQRKPRGVDRVYYERCVVTSDGRIDRAHFFEGARAIADAFEESLFGGTADAGVVEAGHRFRGRSHRWTPTAEDRRALAEALERKAGRPLDLAGLI